MKQRKVKEKNPKCTVKDCPRFVPQACSDNCGLFKESESKKIAQIKEHLETNIPYVTVNKDKSYISSLWHRFKPENLYLYEQVQKDIKHLEIDYNLFRIKLKRILPEKNISK